MSSVQVPADVSNDTLRLTVLIEEHEISAKVVAELKALVEAKITDIQLRKSQKEEIKLIKGLLTSVKKESKKTKTTLACLR